MWQKLPNTDLRPLRNLWKVFSIQEVEAGEFFFLPVRPCHGERHGHRHKQTQTWTDTDRQRHTDCNSQEGKCCGSKDRLLVRIWPFSSRMWTFQWMVPFPWVMWTTQIGLWGFLKAPRGYKVGRGGFEEGELQGEVGIKYDQNTFYEIGKELIKH